MRIFFTLLIALTTTIFANNTQFKRYKFKSGMVYYDVKVSSFDDNLNSQVRGIARLIFDDWGAKELKEEDLQEVQTGDFNDTKARHSMNKIDYGTVYAVDFDEKIIYKTRDRDLDLAIAQKLDLSNEAVDSLIKLGAKKVGKEKIAGLECDVWEYKDQQVCLYEGIPLKIVVQNAGFYSEKVASGVILNKPVPPKEFDLPNFKIVQDESYSENEASLTRTDDFIESIKELKSKMKEKGINLDDKNLTITPDLEKDIINILGAKYLEKQKKYLPSLIKALKNSTKCIAKAKTKDDVNKCLEPVKEIDNKLGDKAPHFDIEKLDEATKQKIINALNEEIKNTEVTAKCVAKYNKTTDVIICTEGTLFPQEETTNAPIEINR
jgi:hypothetical protein